MTRTGGPQHNTLMQFARAVAAGETGTALRLLATSPDLPSASLREGATRDNPRDYFLADIRHYLYAGDTALHVAAAAHRPEIARKLIAGGSNVRARNRRGAEPLHYAADGAPGSDTWDPGAQAATVAALTEAGADPNALDKSGVTPLHRAVRAPSASAVSALLAGGADVQRRNKNGSTPMQIATETTGRSGSGSPEAKAQQSEIVLLLRQYGA